MLLGILGYIFSIAGIVGYYIDIPVLTIIATIFIIIEALIGLFSGELRNIKTYILAIIIGLCVAYFKDLNIPSTIAVALCFEELVMGIMSIIYLIIIAIAKNK